MQNFIIIRGGNEVGRRTGEIRDGRLILDSGRPQVLRCRMAATGMKAAEIEAALNSGQAPQDAWIARMGINPGGDEVVLASEWAARQDALLVAEAQALGGVDEAIPGLAALKAAYDRIAEYDRARAAADNRGDGRRPAKPADTRVALARLFPCAAAYLHAECFALAANAAKAAAGAKAKAAILAGADPQTTIAAMEAEWKAAYSEHVWD